MAEATTRYRFLESSLGKCYIVGSMSVLDDVPEILASRLAVWLEDEVPILRALEPEQRATLWRGRMRALESERELRAEDKNRTVFGPSGSTQEAVVEQMLDWL